MEWEGSVEDTESLDWFGMGFSGVLGSRVGEIHALPTIPSPAQYPRPSHLTPQRKLVSRLNVRIVAKAAAVDAPAKVASAGKPSNAKGSPAKLTPEECSDIYRDMKLGREFEEM